MTPGGLPRQQGSSQLKMNEQSQQSTSGQQGAAAGNAYLRHLLQGEANRNAQLRRTAGYPGFPLGGSGSTSFGPRFGQSERLLRAGAPLPPSLRASQSLDLAGLAPTSLHSNTSLELAPSRLRAAHSLGGLDPPGLSQNTSLELARRSAAGLGGPRRTYPSSSLYDQQRLFMAQPPRASFAGAATGGPFLGAATASSASVPVNPLTLRNLPNEGASTQGLELLRAASLSLPNRSSMSPPRIMPDARLASSVAAAQGGGTMSRFSSEVAAAAAARGSQGSDKRKANDGNVSDDDEATSFKRVYVPEIRDLDIIAGRGGKSNHHYGNKRYRQVVSEMKMMYRSTEAKTVKTDLSRAIVDHVCGYGGRFVKKDDSGRYYLLTKSEARKKTSQALRETKALKWTM